MIAVSSTLSPWPEETGTTTETTIFIATLIALVLAAVICWGIKDIGLVRYSRRTWAVLAIGFGAAGVFAAVFGLLAALPSQQIANDKSDAAQAEWTADVVEWAASEYGVTAGAEDLAGGGSVSLFYGSDYATATVIAQGEIADVELRYIGTQAVLMVTGGDSDKQLPKLETAE